MFVIQGFQEYIKNPQGYKSQLDAALDEISNQTPREIALIRQEAIELFRSIILGNWPFLAGTDKGYLLARTSIGGPGVLTPTAAAMFVPTPLRNPTLLDAPSLVERLYARSAPPMDQDDSAPSHPIIPFTPTPLHPSPTPRFPHAHPTSRTWTAYIALLAPEDIPEAFQWMRAADELLRPTDDTCQRLIQRSEGEYDALSLFRPERAALLDALVRWEGAMLAQETPVGRAWSERSRRMRGEGDPTLAGQDDEDNIRGLDTAGDNDGIGQEGQLRAWLVDWLGPKGVPSRDEVARARMEEDRI